MSALLEWFEGLSLSQTSAVAGALSALVTVFVLATFRRELRWPAVLVGPFLVAAILYSLPVWIGADSEEYSRWAGVFIAVWGLSGVCVSALILIIWSLLSRRSAR